MTTINIEFEVTTSFQITVEREIVPVDSAELLESVTRDELMSAEIYPIEWDHIKASWRSATPANTWITDSDNEPLYPCPEHF